jgi:hypothetical protein
MHFIFWWETRSASVYYQLYEKQIALLLERNLVKLQYKPSFIYIIYFTIFKLMNILDTLMIFRHQPINVLSSTVEAHAFLLDYT